MLRFSNDFLVSCLPPPKQKKSHKPPHFSKDPYFECHDQVTAIGRKNLGVRDLQIFASIFFTARI